jgi:hypothetical protein
MKGSVDDGSMDNAAVARWRARERKLGSIRGERIIFYSSGEEIRKGDRVLLHGYRHALRQNRPKFPRRNPFGSGRHLA